MSDTYPPSPTDLQAIAAEIAHLQTGRTGSDDERRIRDLILGVRGPALTALKRLIDAGGNYRTLIQLVVSDLDDAHIRIQVIAHLSTAAPRLDPVPIKLLSDIDDTIFSSVHDSRFARGLVYPGVRAFHAELDAGPTPASRRGDLVLLSARPQDRLGLMEDYTLQNLHDAGVFPATLLAGNWTGLVSHEAMAQAKLENYRTYAALHPEFDFCFTGDNGQGDAIFAESLLKEAGPRVRGAFIHVVTGFAQGQRERFEAAGIRFFETWAGAAVLASRVGLIDQEAVGRVVAAAEVEAAAISADWRESPWGLALIRESTLGPRTTTGGA